MKSKQVGGTEQSSEQLIGNEPAEANNDKPDSDDSFSLVVEEDDGHSSYGAAVLEEEGDDDEENGIDQQHEDEAANIVLSRPIVVGYAFGPKKMSTMGVVMAEASKTRLSTKVPTYARQQQQQHQKLGKPEETASDDTVDTSSENPKKMNGDDENPMDPGLTLRTSNLLTKELLSSFASEARAIRDEDSSTGAMLQSQSETATTAPSRPPTSVMFSLDNHYTNSPLPAPMSKGGNQSSTSRNIVRQLHSSSPSMSSWGSTGTRTASTAASVRTLSVGGAGSNSNSYAPHATATTDSSSLAPTSYTGKSSRGKHHKTHSKKTKYPIRVSFVPLDPEIPLEEQHGGIDVILHKLTEDILLLSQLSIQHPELKRVLQHPEQSSDKIGLSQFQLDESEEAAVRRVHRLCHFQRQHGCSLVDDPIYVQTLMRREKIASVLETCLLNVQSLSGVPVSSPKYVVVFAGQHNVANDDGDDQIVLTRMTNAVNQAQLSFPLIVKPLIAAGTKASHSMAIVTHPSGLNRVIDRVPCLLQEYTNHDASLYKVYVLGEFVSVHKRRSLPNLPSYEKSISAREARSTDVSVVVEFDSQRPYPRLPDFGYDHSLEETAREHPTDSGLDPSTIQSGMCTTNSLAVTADEVRPIVDALKAAFGLEIFGFDVLIASTASGKDPCLLVVDVNYFPSYKEVPNFPALLAKFLTGRAVAGRLGRGATAK